MEVCLVKGISGFARFLYLQSFSFSTGSLGMLVFYGFEAFAFERDLWLVLGFWIGLLGDGVEANPTPPHGGRC